jgi:ABC-type lipoprotein release transport system permease subunit
VFLALLAALAAGVALAALGAGRRGGSSFDRLVAFADPPELIVTFCPPEMDVENEFDMEACFAYRAPEEQAVIQRIPGVRTVARAIFSGVTAVPVETRQAKLELGQLLGSQLFASAGAVPPDGRPMVVAGRSLDPEAADEVLVNERFRDMTGLGIGDQFDATFWGEGELGRFPQPGETLNGPSARVRIVGVHRGVFDLTSTGSLESQTIEEAELLGGPALLQALDGITGYGGLVIDLEPGVELSQVLSKIEQAFPDRPFNADPSNIDADTAPVQEAIDYEARSVSGFGVVAAVAALVVIAQAVARQTRREWFDARTLSAVGVSDSEMRMAAMLRTAVVAGLAAAGAVALAVALSPLGPIGIGGRAEVDPGVAFDWPVLCVGALLLVVLLVGASWCALIPPRRRHVASGGSRRARVLAGMPPSAVAGLGLAGDRRGQRSLSVGTAYLAGALGVAAVVAGAGLVHSLRSLTTTPQQFGAAWDLSIANIAGQDGDNSEIERAIANSSDVEAAGGIFGTDGQVGDHDVWLQATLPVEGHPLVRPVITEGREPTTADEVALGAISMRELDLSVGDTLELVGTTFREPLPVTVVGVTVVNDTYETSPGRGGVATAELIAKLSPESAADPHSVIDPYVVRLGPDADAERFSASFEARLPVVVERPVPHAAIRNVERIDRLPVALAVAITALALASIGHALTLSIRRARPQLAVWGSLGMTPSQIRASVAWYASSIALAAIAFGIPLGVVLGRLGWQSVARQIGVPSDPVVPIATVVVAVAGALSAVNLIAVYPGWRASRVPVAEALRAE